jgi:hypothetical protein
VTTVTAPERQSVTSKIGERRDLAPGSRHDFGLPPDVCVAHGNRAAAVLAPGIGL